MVINEFLLTDRANVGEFFREMCLQSFVDFRRINQALRRGARRGIVANITGSDLFLG